MYDIPGCCCNSQPHRQCSKRKSVADQANLERLSALNLAVGPARNHWLLCRNATEVIKAPKFEGHTDLFRGVCMYLPQRSCISSQTLFHTHHSIAVRQAYQPLHSFTSSSSSFTLLAERSQSRSLSCLSTTKFVEFLQGERFRERSSCDPDRPQSSLAASIFNKDPALTSNLDYQPSCI